MNGVPSPASSPSVRPPRDRLVAEMKFRVHMKDPDGIFESFDEAAKAEAQRLDGMSGGMLDAEDLVEKVKDKIKASVGSFFEYGDYCVVEVDTDAGTAVVIKKGG
jgi:hypothetical protein